MKSLDWIISLVEVLLYVALPLFVASTLYLISVVKKSNYKLAKDAVTNPVLPNFNLSFFRKLQNEYLLMRKNKIPALANRVSFFTLIISFLLLFFLVMIQELSRY
ncbi:hypothetical protein C6A37_02690 [Desulfobacteraceae bacterium SEEP-SAG9]|nr:hypothetical protein C6A37_02690 [Desulfobacteraceae bacterium SEEP-SAG9]